MRCPAQNPAPDRLQAFRLQEVSSREAEPTLPRQTDTHTASAGERVPRVVVISGYGLV